ncbi:hypothetical protein CXG81DRAFT_20054 [Caulochytrium protostelioides]|uniref:Uncharacterized protein n=1 Tax=Caulochytrium protostelioides TaxID=1555241 RepID=A0A4P9X4F1_9FUNG|nr:hypothetical protein CXG81DRAFT_20054 [Caulochytrium protostelioides]|eukprot:RKO99920.1 hypothetical protein CXG81DRAFT_20054 [Caulochytrium protostelioides]
MGLFTLASSGPTLQIFAKPPSHDPSQTMHGSNGILQNQSGGLRNANHSGEHLSQNTSLTALNSNNSTLGRGSGSTNTNASGTGSQARSPLAAASTSASGLGNLIGRESRYAKRSSTGPPKLEEQVLFEPTANIFGRVVLTLPKRLVDAVELSIAFCGDLYVDVHSLVNRIADNRAVKVPHRTRSLARDSKILWRNSEPLQPQSYEFDFCFPLSAFEHLPNSIYLSHASVQYCLKATLHRRGTDHEPLEAVLPIYIHRSGAIVSALRDTGLGKDALCSIDVGATSTTNMPMSTGSDTISDIETAQNDLGPHPATTTASMPATATTSTPAIPPISAGPSTAGTTSGSMLSPTPYTAPPIRGIAPAIVCAGQRTGSSIRILNGRIKSGVYDYELMVPREAYLASGKVKVMLKLLHVPQDQKNELKFATCALEEQRIYTFIDEPTGLGHLLPVSQPPNSRHSTATNWGLDLRSPLSLSQNTGDGISLSQPDVHHAPVVSPGRGGNGSSTSNGNANPAHSNSQHLPILSPNGTGHGTPGGVAPSSRGLGPRRLSHLDIASTLRSSGNEASGSASGLFHSTQSLATAGVGGADSGLRLSTVMLHTQQPGGVTLPSAKPSAGLTQPSRGRRRQFVHDETIGRLTEYKLDTSQAQQRNMHVMTFVIPLLNAAQDTRMEEIFVTHRLVFRLCWKEDDPNESVLWLTNIKEDTISVDLVVALRNE